MQGNKGIKNVIVELSFEFALKVITYVELLENEKKFVIARQLLKSATSIGRIFGKRRMQKVLLILFIK